jgi:uncharacterized protein
MSTKIFVNLPVKDLDKSKAFYGALGYTFNPQFTDETAACMVISEDIFAMLLTEAKFREFTPRAVADATKVTEVLVALSAESRDKVSELVDKAVAAGGSEVRPPMDYGFMFNRSYADLDGHIWEIVWMDPSAIQQG